MDIIANLGPGGIAKLLSPSPVDFPREGYEGLEFRYGRLTFRPAEFMLEGLVVTVVLLYLISGIFGTKLNSTRVNAWVKAHIALYDAQFAKPGNEDTILADGPTDYMLFSTGRRAVAYLQTVFNLFPRQDILQAVYEFGWSMVDLEYSRDDVVTLDFKLSAESAPPFVFGIVSKYHIKQTRKERFDLVCAFFMSKAPIVDLATWDFKTYFTKTTDSSLLPANACLMSEHTDVTELVLKSPAGTKLISRLADPTINRYFRSFVISDQPEKRPVTGPIPASKKERRVILSLTLPRKSESGVTIPLVQAVFDLIDWLDTKPTFKDEHITRKLIKARTELDATLTKEFAEPTEEEKEAAEEAKRAAKRKAEEEKYAGMTVEQQRKYEEKERKKALRKAQGKMVFKQ
ncbi:hypothetical protein FRC04_006995 [Tulasnella sp. 424]|nr:hypothetical protein FRC04_006995 [Tulasnella sp. 424]KAG8973035.1 hypothetical protein FRC05_009150 [Tulasnella sp. 425]